MNPILSFMQTIMIILLSIVLIILSIEHMKIRKESKQLKVFAVYNKCAVFTSTDFSGIKFNHEKTQVFPK